VTVVVPDSLLAERARLGLDIRDEMWEGVLHMTPSPETEHQRIGLGLVITLRAAATRHGLEAFYELSTFRNERDYRVPDLVLAAPEAVGRKGIVGTPAFAVEIRSPGDDTYEKLPFYASIGLPELLVVDRDSKAVELFLLVEGELRPDRPDADGWFRSSATGLAFRTATRRLEVDDAGTITNVP
jgi:Uma2 family endonuclease